MRPRPACSLSTATSDTCLCTRAPRLSSVAIFVEPSPFTYVSGYNTRFRATIRELRKLGVEVLVVTTGAGRSLPGVPFPAGTEPPATFEGATVIGTPSFGCPLYWQVPLSLGVTPRVWDALRAFRPQLIHVTSPGVMPLAAWAFARVLDVPLLASYHTHVPAYLPSYRLSFLASPLWACIGALHWRAHATVAASASLASELVGAGASPRGATLTWRKAVDPDAFSPSWRCAATRAWLQGRGPQPAASAAPVVAARTAPPAASPSSSPAASPPLDDDSPLLLYVGRLGAEKNLSFLVPLLASAPPAARLAIVGDGPARADAEAAFAADPDAAKRVLFTGELRGAALSRAYASADAFLMPSETETLGFVVLEAMASGLPVVAVAAGGLPDIVTRPGANGFLYPPGDVASASARVNELCANAHLRRAVGAAATEEAAKWGWEAATQALLRSQYALAVALHAKGLHRGGLQLRGGGRRAGGGGESGGEGREGQEGEGGATAHRGTGARVQMAAHAALGGLKLAATLRPRAPAQRAGRAAVGRAAKRLRRALSSG